MTAYQREVLRCIDLEEIGMADVAKTNTEKYRKGAFAVTVVGADGAPLKGAKLRFDLKNHDFKFGSTTFLADTITKPQEARLYRERFAKLFNQGVVAFYWRDDEPTEGHCRFKKDSPYIYRRPPADTALEFCKDVGAQPKGHNLIWQNDAIGIPDWAKDDPEHLKSALIKRIRKIAEEYGDKLPVWDVTNECTGFYNHHMPQGYDTLAWLLATKLMSDNHLILNDYACFFDDFRGPFSALYLQAQKLMAQGAKIDAVGMQYHLFEDKAGLLNKARHSNMLNARHIYHVLDTYRSAPRCMFPRSPCRPTRDRRKVSSCRHAWWKTSIGCGSRTLPSVRSFGGIWRTALLSAIRRIRTGTKMPTAAVFCATICRQSPPMMCSTVSSTPNGTPMKRPKRAKTALRPSPDFTAPTPSPYHTAAKRRTRPFTLKKEKQIIR